ncbi:MAG: AmmeMemoRadiSam system radical SAM enzyme [Atribacterota bacterium]|nr:AmmeMemoRadiSam system radical SAM enzyme [Atribacterota bacterium]
MKEARFWERVEEIKKVRCLLCPHHCLLEENQTGVCRVRQNRDGILYTQTYGKIAALALDPVEKKPLYHFYPGRNILSIGSVGCNLRCIFCQNWHISQVGFRDFPLQDVSGNQLVEMATNSGSVGIAYTYNEPLISWEFVYDTAFLAREKNLKNVLVTNGYVEKKPLQELLSLIDAMNIDLKSMDEVFYQRYCGGKLSVVLSTIEMALDAGVHVEITNLLVSCLNDRLELVERLVDWIAQLSPTIPLHFSRYFPAYRLDYPPTSLSVLEEAFVTAKKKLYFVYLGNVLDAEKSSTFCPSCGKLLVRRSGYVVNVIGLEGKRCKFCQTELPFFN